MMNTLNYEFIDTQINILLKEFESIINNHASISKCENDDCLELKFTLARQLNYNEFAEFLGQKKDVNFLYSYKENYDKNCSFVCFPKPSVDLLCIYYIDSFEYGIIDSFYIAVFDSLEKMFLHLRTSLFNFYMKQQRGYPFTVLECYSPNSLIADFF